MVAQKQVSCECDAGATTTTHSAALLVPLNWAKLGLTRYHPRFNFGVVCVRLLHLTRIHIGGGKKCLNNKYRLAGLRRKLIGRNSIFPPSISATVT